MKQRLPWWAKMCAKGVLSRLPLAYSFWQQLGLFRHGGMDTTEYAARIFDTHVERAQLSGRLLRRTILELGPGDSIATAIIGAAHGAKTILVDSGAFAHQRVDIYKALSDSLRERGLAGPDLSNCTSLEAILRSCNAQYLTQGLRSLASIPDNSVDLVFSQAVLEHVRRDEFAHTFREVQRILRPDGICSHRVDLKDHLDGGLNNLRFSRRVWESALFVRSGFYTNRIRCSQMLGAFADAGFTATVLKVDRWQTLPIAKTALAAEFLDMPDDELLISGFDVLLTKATTPNVPISE